MARHCRVVDRQGNCYVAGDSDLLLPDASYSYFALAFLSLRICMIIVLYFAYAWFQNNSNVIYIYVFQLIWTMSRNRYQNRPKYITQCVSGRSIDIYTTLCDNLNYATIVYNNFTSNVIFHLRCAC